DRVHGAGGRRARDLDGGPLQADRRALPRPSAAPASRLADHARLRRTRPAERRPRLCARPRAGACGRLRHGDGFRPTHPSPGAARMRVGVGVDAHALVEGVPLVLGGVELDSARGLAGHSDGDVIAHALIDAVLGAAGLGDIGSLFPSGAAEWEGASSLDLLSGAYRRVMAAGYVLVNADCILVGEEPRIAARRDEMRARLA